MSPTEKATPSRPPDEVDFELKKTKQRASRGNNIKERSNVGGANAQPHATCFAGLGHDWL
jgi:hypothetical protein